MTNIGNDRLMYTPTGNYEYFGDGPVFYPYDFKPKWINTDNDAPYRFNVLDNQLTIRQENSIFKKGIFEINAYAESARPRDNLTWQEPMQEYGFKFMWDLGDGIKFGVGVEHCTEGGTEAVFHFDILKF